MSGAARRGGNISLQFIKFSLLEKKLSFLEYKLENLSNFRGPVAELGSSDRNFTSKVAIFIRISSVSENFLSCLRVIEMFSRVQGQS